VKRWAASLACLLALAACSQPLTVEQRVIHTIREMEAKLEDNQRRAFLEHIAVDFMGQRGQMTREQVRALVVFQLSRYESLQGQLFPIEVTETGPETAEARFRALVTGGAGLIPESGRFFDFETGWRLESGDWLLVFANWDPVDLDEVIDKLPLPEPDP
jgi:hypothetical protein